MNSAVMKKTLCQGSRSAGWRSRAGNEARYPIGLHVDRVAQTQLDFGQQLAAIGVEDDVLRRGEKGHRRSQTLDLAGVKQRRPQRRAAQCRRLERSEHIARRRRYT
jgi:hypothetical protein